MKPLACTLIICAVILSAAAPRSVFAQSNTRIARITILLDYEHARADFDGWVVTGDGSAPDLSAWGLKVDRAAPPSSGGNQWSIHGAITDAHIESPDGNGFYHLTLDSLNLGPNDDLTLILPFVNIDYANVVEPPDNLNWLIAPPSDAYPCGNNAHFFAPTTPPSQHGLSYCGSRGHPLTLNIPFIPIQKRITLTITPLIGRMLRGDVDGFSLAGRVVFEHLGNYDEFNRHCQDSPQDLAYRYNTADLLFALDSLPALNSDLVNSIYAFKPTYAIVRVDLTRCSFDATDARVEATFTGGAFASPPDREHFPEAWASADITETNQVTVTPRHERAYALRMGEIALGPTDVLTVTLDGVVVRAVAPAPTRADFSRDNFDYVYEGPKRFALSVTYAPQPELVYGQLPSVARAQSLPAEQTLSQLENAPVIWIVMLFAAIALFAPRIWRRSDKRAETIAHARRHLARRVVIGIVWAFAAIILLYGLRGVFGLLALAILLYLATFNTTAERARGLVGLALLGLAIYLDVWAKNNLFAVLSSLELETTSVTPVILLGLGLALVALFAFPRPRAARLLPRLKLERLFPRAISAVAIALFAFAIYDALQKSLLGLALFGIGGAYLAYRLRFARDPASYAQVRMSYAEIRYRFRLVVHSRLIPLGFGVLVLFAAQNGLHNTAAVLGSQLGVWSAVLPPLLVVISIVTSFLAIGALFILLYPILPSNAGYLKATTLGLSLLLIFVFGIASDEHLASTWQTLILGRLVYYLCVPLLIGIYLDAAHFGREQASAAGAAPTGEPPLPILTTDQILMYFKDLRGQLTTLTALASLIAPGAFAFFSGVPLVTTYFDLLEKLISLSLPVVS